MKVDIIEESAEVTMQELRKIAAADAWRIEGTSTARSSISCRERNHIMPDACLKKNDDSQPTAPCRMLQQDQKMTDIYEWALNPESCNYLMRHHYVKREVHRQPGVRSEPVE